MTSARSMLKVYTNIYSDGSAQTCYVEKRDLKKKDLLELKCAQIEYILLKVEHGR